MTVDPKTVQGVNDSDTIDDIMPDRQLSLPALVLLLVSITLADDLLSTFHVSSDVLKLPLLLYLFVIF